MVIITTTTLKTKSIHLLDKSVTSFCQENRPSLIEIVGAKVGLHDSVQTPKRTKIILQQRHQERGPSLDKSVTSSFSQEK